MGQQRATRIFACIYGLLTRPKGIPLGLSAVSFAVLRFTQDDKLKGAASIAKAMATAKNTISVLLTQAISRFEQAAGI